MDKLEAARELLKEAGLAPMQAADILEASAAFQKDEADEDDLESGENDGQEDEEDFDADAEEEDVDIELSMARIPGYVPVRNAKFSIWPWVLRFMTWIEALIWILGPVYLAAALQNLYILPDGHYVLWFMLVGIGIYCARVARTKVLIETRDRVAEIEACNVAIIEKIRARKL